MTRAVPEVGDTVREDWNLVRGTILEISPARMALVQWPTRSRWSPIDLLVVLDG